MNTEKLVELINQSNIFKHLEHDFIQILGENSEYVELESDTFIFSAREPADKFYLIINGSLSIQMFSQEKGSVSIEEIKNGELVGWSWLKPPFMWRFDALTLTKITLIIFDAQKIKKIMDKNKSFGYAIQNIFLDIITERLQSTRLRLLKEFGDNIYIPD